VLDSLHVDEVVNDVHILDRELATLIPISKHL